MSSTSSTSSGSVCHFYSTWGSTRTEGEVSTTSRRRELRQDAAKIFSIFPRRLHASLWEALAMLICAHSLRVRSLFARAELSR
jgi:capsule polysaccharide export protein KpsC/LpsZ